MAEIDFLDHIKTYDLSGHETQVLDAGQGSPVVFVPAFDFLWSGYRHQLHDLVGQYRLISYSRMESAESRLKVAAWSHQLASLLRVLELPMATIVAHSNAGLVALDFAIRYPDQVRALVISGSTARFEFSPAQKALAVLAPLASQKSLARHLSAEVGKGERDAVAQILMEIEEVPQLRRKFINGIYNVLKETDLSAQLPDIHAPTLVVVGEEDSVMGAEASVHMARRIPKARLAVVKRAGHAGPLARPSEYNRLLREFFDELGLEKRRAA